jgi:hypothetical protein
MIVLLNLIPAVLVLVALLAWMFWAGRAETLGGRNRRRSLVLGLLVCSFGLYSMIQPSYIHKGQITRQPLPSFTPSEQGLQDRVKRTDPDQHYQEYKAMHQEFIEDSNATP